LPLKTAAVCSERCKATGETEIPVQQGRSRGWEARLPPTRSIFTYRTIRPWRLTSSLNSPQRRAGPC